MASDPSEPLSRARRLHAERFERLLSQVEWKLAEMPLPRVQVVGDTPDEFLYRIAWGASIKRREFESAAFDRNLYLVEGAGEGLVRLAGLLRPLIQREWARMVAGLNRDMVQDARLEEFLFGVQRISTSVVRKPLRDLQNNRCFYCDAEIKGMAEVDHFLPWVRHPDNGIENLVVTDQSCNNYKRDFLAAADHVVRWKEDRLDRNGVALAEIAEQAGWERHPERTLAVARSLYLRLPEGAKLWLRGREFVGTDVPALSISLK
jgi:5-methylcytosine-specific restriction endonuclease McrA